MQGSSALALLRTMDTDLKSLLEKNGVHTDVITWLGAQEQQCFTLKTFANWVDSKSELKDAVLGHTSQGATVTELAAAS